MKGIRKRGNSYFIDYYYNGRRYREAIGTNYKLAEIVLKKRQTEITEGRFLDKKKNEKFVKNKFSKPLLKFSS